MNRRHFFRTAAALALPLSLGFTGDADARTELRLLTTAWQSARAAGRKVLVLLVPDTPPEARWTRQDAWGESLTWGGERVLALLGQVELVCVRRRALDELVPGLPVELDGSGDPWAFFLDPATLPVRSAGFATEWAPAPGRFGFSGGDSEGDWETAWRKQLAAETSFSEGRVTAFVDELLAAAKGIVPPLSSLSASVRGEVLARGKTMLRGALPGAMWSSSGGCGSHPDVPEDGDGPMYACGMGYVPARSERFVQFLAPWPDEPG